MAVRVKIKTYENNHVHFDFVQGGQNYTLCGLETGGDESLGIGYPKTVKRKVNCPECVRLVEYCHSIKKSEFEPNK